MKSHFVSRWYSVLLMLSVRLVQTQNSKLGVKMSPSQHEIQTTYCLFFGDHSRQQSLNKAVAKLWSYVVRQAYY